ncbi:DUF362 domain-containing protein [Candidatus Woesearchaeota archaeon]|nr:DUF362 domain-containing protein [Candidatus Woesearchaeota archaeon]
MVKVLRWVCRKCNKKWLYPIDKCIYCKENVEKEIGVKTKVIGVSKVNVPSPYHPIVPYYVLILEDENGSRMPKKSMREWKIGDEYKWQPSDDESAVSIVKIKYDIYEAVKEALELIEFEFDKNAKIMVKPEIIAKAYPYMAFNTNPKVIDAILKILIEKGAKAENIIVAERCQFDPMEEALPRSEIDNVCEKYKVKFVDLAKSRYETKKAGNFEFEIAKEVLDKGLIINVPVLKTHLLLGIAGALENMTKVVSEKTYKEMSSKKPEEIAQAIALLNKSLKYITIGDGTIGMQGNGPAQYGEPAFLNMILASKDPVALDSVFKEIALLRQVPYLDVAEKLGVGTADIREITIVGEELGACQRELKPALGSRLIKF